MRVFPRSPPHACPRLRPEQPRWCPLAHTRGCEHAQGPRNCKLGKRIPAPWDSTTRSRGFEAIGAVTLLGELGSRGAAWRREGSHTRRWWPGMDPGHEVSGLPCREHVWGRSLPGTVCSTGSEWCAPDFRCCCCCLRLSLVSLVLLQVDQRLGRAGLLGTDTGGEGDVVAASFRRAGGADLAVLTAALQSFAFVSR